MNIPEIYLTEPYNAYTNAKRKQKHWHEVIEEQALKLGVPLTEYAGRAINAPAPISSDRCTVFMERDINNYLTEGYTIDEVLASVLHSVCENYLAKVAAKFHKVVVPGDQLRIEIKTVKLLARTISSYVGI